MRAPLLIVACMAGCCEALRVAAAEEALPAAPATPGASTATAAAAPAVRTPATGNAAPVMPSIFAPRAPVKKSPAKGPLRTPGAVPSRRAISPEMAVKLGAVVSQVVPPAPTGREAATRGAESGEAGGADAAVQLDPFYVEEEKLPEFKERELLTQKGKIALAQRLHPGLNLGRLPLGNDLVALELAEAEFAKQRAQELRDLGGLMRIKPDAATKDVQRKIDGALLRTPDPSSSGGPFREKRDDGR